MAADVSVVGGLTIVGDCNLGVFTRVDIALSGILRARVVCLAGVLTTYVYLVWVLNISLARVLKITDVCLAGVLITDFSLVGVLKVADLYIAGATKADFFL